MAITFDTLEYVNKLKAADVPQKQAEAQAQALRGVLDAALLEQTRQQEQNHVRALENLDTKTERAIEQLRHELKNDIFEVKNDIATVKNDIVLIRKDMEAMENRLVTRLTKVMIAVVGISVGVIGAIAGVARLLLP